MARFATAFPSVGRIKGQGDEAAFRHGLRIQARGLFLYRAKGATEGNRRQLAVSAFRLIEVCGESDAVAVLEGHLPMFNLFALAKGLVPHSLICRVGWF